MSRRFFYWSSSMRIVTVDGKTHQINAGRATAAVYNDETTSVLCTLDGNFIVKGTTEEVAKQYKIGEFAEAAAAKKTAKTS